jgi:hypothetical protein
LSWMIDIYQLSTCQSLSCELLLPPAVGLCIFYDK